VGWFQDVGRLLCESKGAAIGQVAWQDVAWPAGHKSVNTLGYGYWNVAPE
jgi:hypothetical protein